MAHGRDAVCNEYRQQAERFAAEAARLEKFDSPLTVARTVAFLAGILAFVLAVADPGLRVLWNVAGTGFVTAFLGLVVWHDRVSTARRHATERGRLNSESMARMLREWKQVPLAPHEAPPEHRAVANDLDLFGPRSLFHLVNAAHTPHGRSMLAGWLLEPAERDTIVSRQAAIAELARRQELRLELALRGRLLAGSLAGPSRFLEWAEGPPWLTSRPVLLWLCRALAAGFVVASTLTLLGAVPAPVGGSVAVAIVLANIVISVLYSGELHDRFNMVSSRNLEIQHYCALFDLVAEVPAAGDRLASIRRDTVETDRGAHYQLTRLSRIIQLAHLRHAGLMGIAYVILQLVILWDIHVAALLEWWQKRCRPLVRTWFDALAEFEALASLAQLAHDQPDWVFADVDPGLDRIVAAALGHPLIADGARVTNDVTVGPTGTLLLVTGSNMSGKSTLLRSIGVNVILAQAGAPVCATAMRLPPLTVTTSMRISDSLADGVSFYMAELRRLKEVVDQAREYSGRADRRLLFLLDEVLQGTNSAERHIAVTRVLAHLIHERSIGAVSTHDLELATAEELANCCTPVHFRETIHGEDGNRRMTFDYVMRPGVATTTNALKLLELVGLGP